MTVSGEEVMGWVRRLPLLSAALLALSGCYSYSYQERNGGDLSRLPIDRNLPESKVRWSMWWGLQGNTFAPVGCADGVHESGDPACTNPIPLCDEGAGQVTVSMPWYSALSMIGTLGIAMPHKFTIYCATNRPTQDSGPPPVGP
ncbi:MAG: hypothetical protein B6A08_17095 [Sorangiineae bacterium NIC37A_2]|jgi:hypothetical protein|nr:MAG: hypothetical protein B6A08_17095 [Sorangiineae bacterium NIC37A_2]